MGPCGYHHCPMELVGTVVLIQLFCQILGVQHRRGPACLGSLLGGVFPTPPSPQPDLDEWFGCGRFVKRSGRRHVLAYSSGWSGRPLHPLPARSWCLSFCPSCVCRSQWSASALQHSAGLCTFAAGVRRPLFSFFREVHSQVSDRNRKGAWIHRGWALKRTRSPLHRVQQLHVLLVVRRMVNIASCLADWWPSPWRLYQKVITILFVFLGMRHEIGRLQHGPCHVEQWRVRACNWGLPTLRKESKE